MRQSPAAVLAVCALAAAAGAQTSPLYITSGQNTNNIIVVQNGQVINSWGTNTGEGPGALAVAGDVRVVGWSNTSGAGYDLNGNPIGQNYSHPGVSALYDGTTDGTFNYTVAFSGGPLYRMNRDYTNPQQIANPVSNTIGVSYDSNNNVLFTHSTSGTIQEWDMNGNLIRNIQLSFSENWRGLAYDATDNTMWLTEHSPNNGRLRQLDRNGNIIQTITVPNLANLSGNSGPLGAEFNIPAPGAAAVLGLGGLAAARRRRA